LYHARDSPLNDNGTLVRWWCGGAGGGGYPVAGSFQNKSDLNNAQAQQNNDKTA
jgi:hypothetical protein